VTVIAEPLPPPPRAFLALLAVPGLALALSVTVVSAYAPPLVAELSSPMVAGALIGGEGLFALLVPVLVGRRSDRTRSRFGSRMPYLVAGGGLAAGCLALLPFAPTLALVALALGGFYLGYFSYFSPYRALYPDCVHPAFQGRALGLQGTLREVGLGLGLVGGGLLFAAWAPLPFLAAAGVLAAVTGFFALRVRDPAQGPAPELVPVEEDMAAGAFRAAFAALRRRPDVRRLLAANALWELAQAALKSFAVLFIVEGLDRTAAAASAIFAIVAVAAVLAAVVGGRFADRHGPRRLVLPAAAVYGAGALLPAVSQAPLVLVAVPLLAFAAALVMTLSFAWLARLTADEEHGLTSGLFGLSQGAGIVLGPLLAGLAVGLLGPVFPGTDGYAAVFVVAGAAVLASLPLAARVPG